MNYNEAIEYLTQCADDNGNHWSGGYKYPPEDCPTCKGTNDAGWLRTPGSRYGWTSAHCAPIVYRAARLESRMNGEGWTVDKWHLDYLMGLAVNDSQVIQDIMRQFAQRASGADVDAMTQGYLECQLWAQTDYDRDEDMSGGPKLDESYDLEDISEEYVEQVRDMFADLIVEHPLAIRMYLRTEESSDFGHDFYLTREHHGAGFWDRGLGELGRYLTDIAHYAGSADDLWDNGNGELSA